MAINGIAVAVVSQDIPTGHTPRGLTVDRGTVLEVLQDTLEYVTALHVAWRSVREHIVDLGTIIRMDEEH